MKRLILTIVISVMLFHLLRQVPKAPVDEFNDFHRVFDEAYKSQAYMHSEELFTDAINLSIKAYEKWHYENSQWILTRNYTEVKLLALLAMSTLEEAKEKSINLSDSLMSAKQY